MNFFPSTACDLIGYFAVTWHLSIELFPANSLWAGNSAKSMTSEGNSALLPANVDRRPPLLLPLLVFLFVLYNKSLNDWSLGKQFILFLSGNKMNCFPRDQSLSVYCFSFCSVIGSVIYTYITFRKKDPATHTPKSASNEKQQGSFVWLVSLMVSDYF